MELKDKKQWNKYVGANADDPYGKACVDYAERWANLMETEMAKVGAVFAEMADHTSHEADTEGITGFMYGAAVAMLSECWTHGETLRAWHNLKTQIGNEGELANAEGGTLNPALLTIQFDGKP